MSSFQDTRFLVAADILSNTFSASSARPHGLYMETREFATNGSSPARPSLLGYFALTSSLANFVI
jgi:hypothetical protein